MVSGGTTSGMKRHLSRNHLEVYEQAMNANPIPRKCDNLHDSFPSKKEGNIPGDN